MNQHPKYTTREAQAMAEIGRTAIGPVTAILLTVAFLAAIAVVPIVQQVSEIAAYLGGKRASPVPQCYDIFRLPPGIAQTLNRQGTGLFRRLLEANRCLMRAMRAYEDRLEDESIVCAWVRPQAQYFLARWLGAGNEKAYCGVYPWLFYRADVEYLTGPGFLDVRYMERRLKSATDLVTAPRPDPRPAILEFHRQLAARGIRLAIMPVPSKAAIHPEKFWSRFERGHPPLQNQSYSAFLQDLERAGVAVVDASAAIAGVQEGPGAAAYLATDTHWRPEAMERAARFVAEWIGRNVPLEPRPDPVYGTEPAETVNRGDVAVMLRLPSKAAGYPPEKAQLRRITDKNRSWRQDESSDVLVLGDSFCNIYSLENMGWGGSAGFIEQLSFELRRPLDRIVINDNGAYAARALLARELARGRDRLAGKRLVLWQFAMRELTSGDWKSFAFNLGEPAPEIFAAPPPGQKWMARGVVRAIAPVPRPGTVPYKDHVVAAHVVDLESIQPDFTGNQALVYLESMRDNVLTRAAGLRPGDSVTLSLSSWSDVAAHFERVNRSELTEPELQIAEPCWGEVAESGVSTASGRR